MCIYQLSICASFYHGMFSARKLKEISEKLNALSRLAMFIANFGDLAFICQTMQKLALIFFCYFF